MDHAAILGPNGEQLTLPHEAISDDELRLLAEYQKWLERRQYKAATFCSRCWNRNLSDGTEFHVKVNGLTIEALIKCRCRVAYGKGGGLPS